MSSINVIQARQFQLAEPIGTSETEITVKNLFDIYGNQIVMSGDIQYITLEPQSRYNQEIISCTGIVQLTETIAKFTGVTRGLDAQPDPVTGLYGSDPSQIRSHASNVEGILSDNPQVWDKKTSKDEEETITEEWTFELLPRSNGGDATEDEQLITYRQALAMATGSAGVNRIAVAGTAGETVAAGDFIYLKSDGSWWLASAAAAATCENVTLGIAQGAGTAGNPILNGVLTQGVDSNQTAMAAGTPYFLSDTPGDYSGSAGTFNVSLGYAMSATSILFTPRWTLQLTKKQQEAMAGTVGTPSSTNKFVTNEDTSASPEPNSVVRFDSTGGLTSSKFGDNSYPAGETLSAGNVVFIEPAPTTAQATSAQNIGDITANTRISFPVFGSGVSASTLKLNLAKVGSPSVNLGVRIETDNGSGNPSGTLVDANATGTVTAASLTTSLADTTVTLGGSFTIPAGQKCHAVVYQGTYGSETVNASNYYKIGYSTNDSTTRMGKYWNGSVWSQSLGALNETTGDTLVYGGSTTNSFGYKITPIFTCTLNSVTQETNVYATRALLKSSTGTILATATFSGNVATFSSYTLNAGVSYRIELDSNGSSYVYYYDSTPSFPTRTNIVYVSGSTYGVDSSNGYNITSINTTAVSSLPFPYTSSTLFSDKVLSKTDADYTYKVDWHGITQEAVTAGDLSTGKYPTIAIEGVDSNQSGMTQGTTMYLSNTAGAISSSAGTNSKKIGKAITASKIEIEKNSEILPYIPLVDGTTYYASTSGFVVAWVTPATNYTAGCSIIADTSSTPTNVVGRYGSSDQSNDQNSSVTAPIPKGNYYKCVSSGTPGTAVFRFYPLA